MGALIYPLLSLLVGIGLLLVGIGLLFPVLGLRAAVAEFPVWVTGLVMSAYFAGFVLGTYLCPALIRRVGYIRAFAAMASIASTMPLLHALFVDPWAWGALRLLTGMCIVGLYMVIESWLNSLAPNNQRGKIFAAYMATTHIAMALGQALILVGDRLGFVPFALASVLLSLALVPVTLTRVLEPKPVAAPRLGLRNLYQTSPLGVVGATVSGLVNGAFFGMGAVYAHRVGMSDQGIAAFMGATIIGGAALQWPIGHYSDNRDRRRVLMQVCVIAGSLAGVGVLASYWSEGVLIALGFVYGGFVFTLYGLSVAHVNDRIDSARLLEVTGGLLLLYGIGAAIGPTAAGVIMDTLGPGSLMTYFAALLIAAAVFAAHRMRLTPPLPAEAQSNYVSVTGGSQAVLQLDPRLEPGSGDASARPGA
ncbi:MAG: MFS transporter [Betaproteobacteria bacterium]|nr:MFS transporter [Betaproteobacteria bacterium]